MKENNTPINNDNKQAVILITVYCNGRYKLLQSLGHYYK